jgi:hypothetical protein
MIIRMSALILENLKSKVIGILQVFGDWQDHNNAAVKPVCEANPGSASGSESTVRGAFRVRKNTKGDANGEAAVLEALPNGNVGVPGELSVGGRTYKYPAYTAVVPPPGAPTVYYVKVITFFYYQGVKLLLEERGNNIYGDFFIDVPPGRGATREIMTEYNKHTAGLGVTGLFFVPVADSSAELWIRVVAFTVSPNTFRFYLSDTLATLPAFAEGNYQTGMPSGAAKMVEIFGVGGIATSGEMRAANAAVAGALNVGDAASFTRVNGDMDVETETGEGSEDMVYSLSLSPALNRGRGLSAVKAVYRAGYTSGKAPADLASACLELAAGPKNFTINGNFFGPTPYHIIHLHAQRFACIIGRGT